jgi:hypothetical protein
MRQQRISKYAVPPNQRSVFLENNGGEGCFWFAWFITVILVLAFWTTVVFVAYHFISKWW